MTKTAVAKGSIRGAAGTAGSTGPAGPAGPGFLGTFQVRDYAANPNTAGSGTSDDTAAINAAIAAALAYKGVGGGRVLFDSGTWGTTQIIDQPELVTVESIINDTIVYSGGATSPCVIRPLAGHPGTAIWRLRGKTESGRTYNHTGARLTKMTFDGTNAPAGTKGLQLIGLVREADIDHVTVRNAKDTAFDFQVGTSASPQSCRIKHCLADSAGNNGYRFSNVPDSTIFDCNSLGATNSGFRFEGFMNGQISNIRAEWSGQHGVLFTSGYWGTGQGSGGCVATNISTDRNGMNGIFVDGTCQGSGSIVILGVDLRRDGRNNGTGGGGYASIAVASGATMPVSIDGIETYPGVDDNGTGTLSPQYGVYTTGTNSVKINSGVVHAAVTALSVTASTIVDPSVDTATGPTTAPVRVPGPGSVSNAQRGPIGGVFNAGTISGTWAPNPVTATAHKAVLSAATTLGPIAAGADFEVLTLEAMSTGATQTLTVDASIPPFTGWPASTQIPVGKICIIMLRYSVSAGRWSLISLTQEQ